MIPFYPISSVDYCNILNCILVPSFSQFQYILHAATRIFFNVKCLWKDLHYCLFSQKKKKKIKERKRKKEKAPNFSTLYRPFILPPPIPPPNLISSCSPTPPELQTRGKLRCPYYNMPFGKSLPFHISSSSKARFPCSQPLPDPTPFLY